MKFATRDALAHWLDALMEDHAVIAPRRVGTELLYRPVTSSAEIVFDFERTALSPKTFFFPDTEVLLEVERRNGEVTLIEPFTGHGSRSGSQVLFAVRPCDARGLRALDALLLERQPADSYYAERREKTTLVGLACRQQWDDCFCTSLGSSPDDSSGMDVMLYEGDVGYWVLVISEKGRALVEGLDTQETDREAPASRAAEERIPVLLPEAWTALFDDGYWRSLADRCLSCRACTYVCPTCRCFDVRDDTTAAGPGYAHIERLRAWDSCLAPGYRRIAGGHNPRPTKAERLRNRYYCKFCYSPRVFGTVACVGCGRCIEVCPVGIDVTEVLAGIARLDAAERRGSSHE
jgi:sulfhydrogenase subunit beta (sulfur reductase)